MNLFKSEPIFKNVTTYNSKLYNKFIKFHNNKFGNKYMYFTIIICIFFVYCIIANFIAKNICISLIILFIMILFLYFRIYFPISNYKKTCRTFSKSKELNFTFTFYNNYFTITNSKKAKKDIPRIYYIKLYKIIEDENYFYLYLNEENATIIDKKGFILGTEKDFCNFLKKKCFFKFKK